MRCQQQKMLRVLPPTYLACQTFRSSTCKVRDGHHNVWADRQLLISSRKCTAGMYSLPLGMNTFFFIWHIYQIAPLCSSRTLFFVVTPGDVSVWNKGSHKSQCWCSTWPLKAAAARAWSSSFQEIESPFVFVLFWFFPGMITVIKQIPIICRFMFILIPSVYKHF